MSATGDRLLERIRRLLSLAQSPNRHEAESAAREAQRLMDAHHVTVASLSSEPDPVESRGVGAAGRPWQVNLAHGVSEVCCVETYRRREVGGWVRVCVGRPDDIACYAAMYAYLCAALTSEAQRGWATYSGDLPKVSYTTSFLNAAAAEVAGRLREERAARRRAETGEALVLVGKYEQEAALARRDYLARSGVKLTSATVRSTTWADPGADGREAGRRVPLRPSQRLLGGGS